MNNQELVKYIFELAYEHWVVTILFIIVATPWNVIRIGTSTPRPDIAKSKQNTSDWLNGLADAHNKEDELK